MRHYLGLLLCVVVVGLNSALLAQESGVNYGKTLTVAMVPTGDEGPLDIGAVIGCSNISELVNPKRGNGELSQVSEEVLAKLPKATSFCFSEASLNLKEDEFNLIAFQSALATSVQAEQDRRQYNELVDRYNSLLGKYGELYAVAERQAATNVILTPVRPAINNVTPYSLPPAIRIESTCAAYKVGFASLTNCQ